MMYCYICPCTSQERRCLYSAMDRRFEKKGWPMSCMCNIVGICRDMKHILCNRYIQNNSLVQFTTLILQLLLLYIYFFLFIRRPACGFAEEVQRSSWKPFQEVYNLMKWVSKAKQHHDASIQVCMSSHL